MKNLRINIFGIYLMTLFQYSDYAASNEKAIHELWIVEEYKEADVA
jgi:hypothetical protein